MAINLVSSIIVFIVSMGINFLLTPFILKSLGNEAYGFVGLSNAIVSYASIITVAINSVSGRFVAYEWHKNNIPKSNIYYSSVLVVNVFFCIVVVVCSGLFLLNINKILDVPPHLENDVFLTFVFYFINFCVGLFNGVITVCAFVKNKLYLISIRNAISSAILAICIVLLFYFFKPMIFYIAISALIASLFVFFSTIFISSRITPELKFSLFAFDFKSIKELFSSGIYNSFNALNRILITGMDLFICNIFLNANMTGILAVSKAAPIILESFVAQISFIFAPKFVELYSKNEIANLIMQSKLSMRITAFILIAPVAVFVAFGQEFYTLWLPFKNKSEVSLIYELSLIVLLPILLISFVFSLFNLDSATNQLRRPAIANTILGFGTILGQIAILKFTNYGIYGIVVTGAIFYSLRICFFDLINASLNLKQSISTFYPTFLRLVCVFMTILLMVFGLKFYINIQIISWMDFVLHSILFAIFGYVFCLFLLFNQKERQSIMGLIKSKLRQNK